MNRMPWLVGSLLGLLLALGLRWFLLNHDRVPEQVELPPRGEARYNTLFALQETLRALSIEVRARPTLQLDEMQLQPGDLLVLASDVRSFGEDDAAALRAFVESGGALLLAAPEGEGVSDAPLLSQLGIALVEVGDESCPDWQRALAASAAAICGSYRLRLLDYADSAPGLRVGTEEHGYALLEGWLGEGRWRALSSIEVLSRKALAEPANRALVEAWLLPLLPEDGAVHLVYAVDVPPFYVLLVRQGWPLLLPLLLALLAWLWQRSQRLGPLLGLPAPDRRALLEHLRAAAEFLFRRGEGKRLHAALHRRFLHELRRDHPALAALQGDALISAVAQHWRLPVDAVRQALYPTQLDQPARFVEAVRTLTHLRAPA